MTTLPPIRILSPTAILGYGFPETSFASGLALNPDVIAVDAGSTDPAAPIILAPACPSSTGQPSSVTCA